MAFSSQSLPDGRAAAASPSEVAQEAAAASEDLDNKRRDARGTDTSESAREEHDADERPDDCAMAELAFPSPSCMHAMRSAAPFTWPTTVINFWFMRGGELTTDDELDAEEAPSAVDTEAESSGTSCTKRPHLLSMAILSKSCAESLPALRTRRCLLRRELRCAALAACIIFFVIWANRFASSISLSMSILGRLPLGGRPTRFGAGPGTAADRSTPIAPSSAGKESVAMRKVCKICARWNRSDRPRTGGGREKTWEFSTLVLR